MSQLGAVVECQTDAVLRSLTSKLARAVTVVAVYDVAGGGWQFSQSIPAEDPEAGQAALAAAQSTDVIGVLANKEYVEQSGAPLTKAANNALALIMAPISDQDAQAGWAASRIQGKFRAGGWRTDKFASGAATESQAWSYLQNGSSLLVWYGNSHGITASVDGAPNYGLAYSASVGYDGNLSSDEFSILAPYTGLINAVVYADACNSYMNPLRSSILTNHNVRTYIGGTRLMPFVTSDNADAKFWKYVLTDGRTMASALTQTMADYSLAGYYAMTGYSGTFGPRPLRTQLTWGARPLDLDLHLYLPNGTHIYWGNRGSVNSNPWALLNADDMNGFGPETIRINEAIGGIYAYKVYNSSNDRALAGSGAKVNLYRGTTLIRTIVVPASGSGRWWNVFTYNTTSGQIVLQNTITTTAPAGTSQDALPTKP
jgi:hypothetical protein